MTYIVQIGWIAHMILDYRDKHTRQFAEGEFVRRFQGFERQASKRLEILNAATLLADLAGLPSNRLEALRGTGQGSIPSASTSIGGFASSGPSMLLAHRRLKSSTTTR